MRFRDREDAGRRLGALLGHYADESPIVLALPRGGVPVGYEVATALGAPLDVWVVRKVGAPDFPELGMGAVAEGGIVYLNPETIAHVGASDDEIDALVRRKAEEVQARVHQYRGNRPGPRLEGRTVILVDDGIATGGTVHAAIQALRAVRPKKIVLAVPVAATDSLETLSPMVDDVVCVLSTPALYAIGAWYDDFTQVEDDEVAMILELAHKGPSRGAPHPGGLSPMDPRELMLSIGDAELNGTLAGPDAPTGLVLFAHGSGSSRFSPRNRHVASVLHRYGLATLLFDLLTREEEAIDEQTAEYRFDIDLLARRLVQVTEWAAASIHTAGLPIGYFGSSTGAAAALVAAATRPSSVGAVVSRGGRPDLAWTQLPQVRAPTLLIVGGNDPDVLTLNERAATRLVGPHRLVVIPGATHLFPEPGTLDAVARLAGEWFSAHLEGAHRGSTAHP